MNTICSTAESITPGAGDALIVVDVQSDFLPGGALAVPEGNAVIPVLNDYLRRFGEKHLPVYATRDWHPASHRSFNTQGGPWPVHCVADTPGADFASALELPSHVVVISKGSAPDREAYSPFEDADVELRLHAARITRLFIGGLATDYCVLNTVCDALKRGFKVCLLIDAIRAVDVCPGDGARAIDQMLKLGAVPVDLARLAA